MAVEILSKTERDDGTQVWLYLDLTVVYLVVLRLYCNYSINRAIFSNLVSTNVAMSVDNFRGCVPLPMDLERSNALT